ncbi:MAG TPA: endonuclease III [Thermodesulfobacteriota bacterium]|nr:endonuclease III [Deltaproteobacteria bacterium]HNR14249.1 endonuclease III [Thermodesulfobacteriota bacterium]
MAGTVHHVGDEKEKVKRIMPLLKKMHPHARCELDFTTPLQLLVATILSAQCTDKRVNEVTKSLFRKYPTARDYAETALGELEEDIRSTGFFRNKAKAIQECGRMIVARFHGSVPSTLEELITLPGIGRKSANVILGNAFGVPGITVDTHVFRVSRRLGLSQGKDAIRVESDLMEIVPQPLWTEFSHLLVFHGRYLCTARKPLCAQCLLTKECDYYQDQRMAS